MKMDQVRVGGTYTAKVSGGVVPVRITDEVWAGDKLAGWTGTNTETGRSVRIKSAQRLRARVDEPGADGAVPGPRATKAVPAAPAVGPDVGDGGVPSPEGAVVAKAGSPTPPKPTSGGKAKKGARTAKAAKAAKAPKAPKVAKPKKERPMSGLDAAAKVLKDVGTPMRVKDIVAAAEKKGLWKSKSGKTPEATVYAAIIREIAAKGGESRFEKKDRGLFAAAGK